MAKKKGGGGIFCFKRHPTFLGSILEQGLESGLQGEVLSPPQGFAFGLLTFWLLGSPQRGFGLAVRGGMVYTPAPVDQTARPYA